MTDAGTRCPESESLYVKGILIATVMVVLWSDKLALKQAHQELSLRSCECCLLGLIKRCTLLIVSEDHRQARDNRNEVILFSFYGLML